MISQNPKDSPDFSDEARVFADEHGLDACGKCGAMYYGTPDDIDNGHDCGQP